VADSFSYSPGVSVRIPTRARTWSGDVLTSSRRRWRCLSQFDERSATGRSSLRSAGARTRLATSRFTAVARGAEPAAGPAVRIMTGSRTPGRLPEAGRESLAAATWCHDARRTTPERPGWAGTVSGGSMGAGGSTLTDRQSLAAAWGGVPTSGRVGTWDHPTTCVRCRSPGLGHRPNPTGLRRDFTVPAVCRPADRPPRQAAERAARQPQREEVGVGRMRTSEFDLTGHLETGRHTTVVKWSDDYVENGTSGGTAGSAVGLPVRDRSGAPRGDQAISAWPDA
jgi:hypothetical protein